MPDLNFQVESAAADVHSAAPQLLFKLRITLRQEPLVPIQSIALRCQLRIEATRRRYNDQEQARLIDLFGEPDRWSRTLGSLLWTHVNLTVPLFDGETTVEMPVPCTFDFNVASTKYFHGLAEGEIPLLLLFSGTIFYRAADGDCRSRKSLGTRKPAIGCRSKSGAR